MGSCCHGHNVKFDRLLFFGELWWKYWLFRESLADKTHVSWCMCQFLHVGWNVINFNGTNTSITSLHRKQQEGWAHIQQILRFQQLHERTQRTTLGPESPSTNLLDKTPWPCLVLLRTQWLDEIWQPQHHSNFLSHFIPPSEKPIG